MKKTTSGFTIVELLIVIVVIGILAAITIVSFNGVQSRARDAERTSDMKSLHKALEMFYIANGYYPAVSDVRDPTYRANVLKIPESIVRLPGSSNTIGYCWADDPAIDRYCYVAQNFPGHPDPSFDCGRAGDQCAGYTITYRLETDIGNRVNLRSKNRP